MYGMFLKTDTALILPETSSRKNIIYFLDVIHILEFQGSLEVLLRNGYVYLLSGNTSAWKLIDIFSEKNHPIYKCALNELNQRLLVL